MREIDSVGFQRSKMSSVDIRLQSIDVGPNSSILTKCSNWRYRAKILEKCRLYKSSVGWIALRKVKRRTGFVDTECVYNPWPLHILIDISIQRVVVNASPSKQATITIVTTGNIMYLGMQFRLDLLNMLIVNPSEKSRTNQRAHSFCDQIGNSGQRRQQISVSIRTTVVVEGENLCHRIYQRLRRFSP